jgi:RNA polymerase sigma-32 factor
MATITGALEREVASIRAIKAGGRTLSHRARRDLDTHFAAILRLIAPRIRHFTRQYGLLDHAEDAAQACAIGVHRAIETYEPARARFTAFVNWQLRAELQGLRFRLNTDHREWAREIGASTVSLDALGASGEAFADDDSLEAAEALASAAMAHRAASTMLDAFVTQSRLLALRREPRVKGCRLEARIARDRAILERQLFGDVDPATAPPLRDERGALLGGERLRQFARRAVTALATQVTSDPRFAPAL